MKKIMMVLSVCLALAATSVSYGALVPLFAGHPETGYISDTVEISRTESVDQPAGSVILAMAAEETVREQSDEAEEGEEEKKGEEDEEKDSEGPDRLWDCCKLG